MKNNKNSKQIIRIIALVLLCILLGVVCFFLLRGNEEEEIDTSEGVQIMQQMAQADVAELEKKIQDVQAEVSAEAATVEPTAEPTAEPTGVDRNIPLAEHMRHALLVGDSIAEAVALYNVLPASCVVSEIGVTLITADDIINRAIALNPQYMFLDFGLNDVNEPTTSAEGFVQDYKGRIDYIRQKLPETKIYVVNITPFAQIAIDKNAARGRQPEFNAALKAFCDQEGIPFIDTSDLITEDSYGSDGIHLSTEYLTQWTWRMVEVAGL